jgi:hypothetical protein
MSRKYIYLFTFLLFNLFHLSSVQAVGEDFPVMGGTTSDSIKISNVKLTNFKKSKTQNSIQLVGAAQKSTMTFDVQVPKGKEAELSYKLWLQMDGDEEDLESSSVTFRAKLDDQAFNPVTVTSEIYSKTRKFNISEGPHKVEFEVLFDATGNCAVAGRIDQLFIHIHQFDETELTREPLCGEDGKRESKCPVCSKKKEITITPKFSSHELIKTSSTKGSCLDNSGEVTKCANCPYTKIKHDRLEEHKFDGDGKCTVCGLSKPKCNPDSTVYEINNAGEMRILSELVSLGRIPSNVGVNINADLVFDEVAMLPLGTFTNPFMGVLNGNGHRISGITSCFQGADGLGIVGVARGTILSHAVIANLIFDGGNNMKGASCIGGIVGHANYCDIINCASFGTLEGDGNIGGIVGYADQHVSITNCASVNTIRTEGRWNPMVCGMSIGQVLNTYGAVSNEPAGRLDSLKSATLRHCFSTHGSGDGLTRITTAMLTSYEMEESLSEESESIPFMMSQKDLYPIPVVNTSVVTKSNGPVPKASSAVARRADSSDEGGYSEKDEEIEEFGGYVAANSGNSGKTVEEVMRENTRQYPDFNSLYIVTRRVPDGTKLYEPVSGGELVTFESYLAPSDSSYIKMREYDIVAPEKVMAVKESVDDMSGPFEQIDEYGIKDGNYSLESRIKIENIFNVVCQQNFDGVMKTVWTIETSYDDSNHPVVTQVFSHNPTTGEVLLEYSYTYSNIDKEAKKEEGSYVEYVDNETNTVHIIYNYADETTGVIESRDHYILRASDLFLQEVRSEKMANGQPQLTDGMYFIYDGEGAIMQTVCFGPVDANNPDSEVRPYMYDEYIGYKLGSPYPTAIQVPTTNHPSLQKRTDPNIYDMQGRVVRKATDMQDPFSGLPTGIYLYQGTKYIKR